MPLSDHNNPFDPMARNDPGHPEYFGLKGSAKTKRGPEKKKMNLGRRPTRSGIDAHYKHLLIRTHHQEVTLSGLFSWRQSFIHFSQFFLGNATRGYAESEVPFNIIKGFYYFSWFLPYDLLWSWDFSPWHNFNLVVRVISSPIIFVGQWFIFMSIARINVVDLKIFYYFLPAGIGLGWWVIVSLYSWLFA